MEPPDRLLNLASLLIDRFDAQRSNVLSTLATTTSTSTSLSPSIAFRSAVTVFLLIACCVCPDFVVERLFFFSAVWTDILYNINSGCAFRFFLFLFLIILALEFSKKAVFLSSSLASFVEVRHNVPLFQPSSWLVLRLYHFSPYLSSIPLLCNSVRQSLRLPSRTLHAPQSKS